MLGRPNLQRSRHLGCPSSAESCRGQNSYCVPSWTVCLFCSRPHRHPELQLQKNKPIHRNPEKLWKTCHPEPQVLSCDKNHESSVSREPCKQDKDIPQVCPWSPESGWSAPQEPPGMTLRASINVPLTKKCTSTKNVRLTKLQQTMDQQIYARNRSRSREKKRLHIY